MDVGSSESMLYDMMACQTIHPAIRLTCTGNSVMSSTFHVFHVEWQKMSTCLWLCFQHVIDSTRILLEFYWNSTRILVAMVWSRFIFEWIGQFQTIHSGTCRLNYWGTSSSKMRGTMIMSRSDLGMWQYHPNKVTRSTISKDFHHPRSFPRSFPWNVSWCRNQPSTVQQFQGLSPSAPPNSTTELLRHGLQAALPRTELDPFLRWHCQNPWDLGGNRTQYLILRMSKNEVWQI